MLGMSPRDEVEATHLIYLSTQRTAFSSSKKTAIVGWVDVVDVRELVLFSDARRC